MSHVRKYGFYILQNKIDFFFIWFIYKFFFFDEFTDKEFGGRLKKNLNYTWNKPQSKFYFNNQLEHKTGWSTLINNTKN